MTFLPLKNTEPYAKAYAKWKQELELILTYKK
jgi:xylulokinase